jgi:hypothetical protein
LDHSLKNKIKVIHIVGEVKVLNYTHKPDPNIKIINSYQIKGYGNKKKLINIIQEDMKYNQRWKRSNKSLMTEFYVHNIGELIFRKFQMIPRCKVLYERAKDTDFTLSDENIYNIENPFKFVHNMIKMILE